MPFCKGYLSFFFTTNLTQWNVAHTATLFDTLHQCFNIKRVIHCKPVNLPLWAKEYIYHDPLDSDTPP